MVAGSSVFDKSQRTDGTFSRDDFAYDHATDTYRCPAGKTLQHYRRRFAIPRTDVCGPTFQVGEAPDLIFPEDLPAPEVQTGEDRDRCAGIHS
jgi:hypothetical protein